MIFHRRDERIKTLTKSLASAARKADKAVIEATQKSVAAHNASSGYDKNRLEDEAQCAWGVALAALDECRGISESAIDAYQST